MIRDAPDSDVANAKEKRSAKAAGKMHTRMALLVQDVQEEPPVERAKGEESMDRDEDDLIDQQILFESISPILWRRPV
jgi:hypothetical protein